MCGRFSLSGDIDFYAEYFGVDNIASEALDPKWNVAPTDPVYVVANGDDHRQLGTMRWGLIPHWAKDSRASHINARVETVANTPAFREAFSRKRCLIPADGFYEWEPKEQGHTPHWVYRADGYPMAFAGLWSAWYDQAEDRWLRSCAIITARAEGVITSIHDRMPISLAPEMWPAWLDRDRKDPNQVRDLLVPIDPDLLMEYPVSPLVNSVRNDGPELRIPAA
jgi:putative SOS response-associated peptidase YedK